MRPRRSSGPYSRTGDCGGVGNACGYILAVEGEELSTRPGPKQKKRESGIEKPEDKQRLWKLKKRSGDGR